MNHGFSPENCRRLLTRDSTKDQTLATFFLSRLYKRARGPWTSLIAAIEKTPECGRDGTPHQPSLVRKRAGTPADRHMTLR